MAQYSSKHTMRMWIADLTLLLSSFLLKKDHISEWPSGIGNSNISCRKDSQISKSDLYLLTYGQLGDIPFGHCYSKTSNHMDQ